MKRFMLLAILMVFCSLRSFAWRYKVQQCEIETVTNSCCFKLWVSIDKVDDDGRFLSHACAGYVYTGCCQFYPAHDPAKENTSCADEYNSEHFYTDKSSTSCMVPIVSSTACYSLYTSARDKAISAYKQVH